MKIVCMNFLNIKNKCSKFPDRKLAFHQEGCGLSMAVFFDLGSVYLAHGPSAPCLMAYPHLVVTINYNAGFQSTLQQSAKHQMKKFRESDIFEFASCLPWMTNTWRMAALVEWQSAAGSSHVISFLRLSVQLTKLGLKASQPAIRNNTVHMTAKLQENCTEIS